MSEESWSIPTHVGFIVDGNRRWARKHGLPTYEGHLAGYQTLKDVVLAAVDKGIKYVSVYVFSTENWSRSKDEVSYLMKLMLKAFKSDLKELIDNQIKVSVLGSREGVDKDILDAIDSIQKQTIAMQRGTVAVCFNYGGQREITDALKACMQDGLKPGDITEDAVRSRLYAPEIPDIDMIVRTSGEQRISNFMLWRAAYSELFFVEKLWPDLVAEDIDAIITEFNRRNRRFGGN